MKRKNTELVISHQNIAQRIPIQELQKKRAEFKNQLKQELNDRPLGWPLGYPGYWPEKFFILCTYCQSLHKKTYEEFANEISYLPVINPNSEKLFSYYNIDRLNHPLLDLEKYRKARHNNYSALGSATMTEDVTLQEKQEFIQKLRAVGFEATPEDKELALVEQWERWEPIAKKAYLLRYTKFFIKMPCDDVVNYILRLTLETEKPLF